MSQQPSPIAKDPAELGRRGGIRSGEVRRAKAQLREEVRAEVRALERFALAADDIAQELLDAALARGKWAQGTQGALLDPKERIAILKTCLEYAVGKARPMAVAAESPPEQAEEKGLSFGVRTPETELPDTAEAMGTPE
jgi:hypothetical protein